MKRKGLFVSAGLLIAAVVAGVAFFSTNSNADSDLALAELNVKKMTCGSCVATITEAVEKIDGVRSVDVSVTTGRSQITFDPGKTDSANIAQVITAAGYPASVLRQLTAQQYQSLQAEQAQLAEIYVAKVGDQLVARDDFNQVVEQRLRTAGLSARPEAPSQVISQAWQGLMQRKLMLADAERNLVVVQDYEVDLQIKQLRQKKPNLDAYIQNSYGSEELFFQQTKEDMIINRNIEEHVLVDVKQPSQRQVRFNQWFQNLVGSAPVVIYDAGLKQTLGGAGGSGCGGGCCG